MINPSQRINIQGIVRVLFGGIALAFAVHARGQIPVYNLSSPEKERKESNMYVEATPWQNQQARRGEYKWKAYPTRVIEHLKDFRPVTLPLDRFGGRTDITEKATGFYHVAQINGRWWNIDPEGHPSFNIGVAAVAPGSSTNEQRAFANQFGMEANWIQSTRDLLLSHGFNSLGAWSDVNELRKSPDQAKHPLSYTILVNFMHLYASKYRKYTNSAYPGEWMKGAIPVFDPEFQVITDQIARDVTKYRDDPNLYGYFTDNELPFLRSNLDTYLAMPSTDPGFKAAHKWMADQHATVVDDKLRAEFLHYEADLYFQIVASALRRYDPTHMVLGSRFTEPEYMLPELFAAAGKHCDVVSVNFYSHWTPSTEAMQLWESAAKKPFLISEFYTKAMDSGLANTTGAGWLVHTQGERGIAYQNVTLSLIESKGAVGWQYFRYQDNDPTDAANTKSNTSDIDGNKGIVNAHYNPYQPLLDRQKQINTNVYSLADYFTSNGGNR
jgi:hypothetical protein